MAGHRKSSAATTSSLPGPVKAGFTNCCPHCGKGRLIADLLTIAPNCNHCGLKFDFADSGDGPAVFVILIIGLFITALAMSVEASYSPPAWVHIVLWGPLTLAASLYGLRFAKGVLISLQYRTKAGQGKLGE